VKDNRKKDIDYKITRLLNDEKFEFTSDGESIEEDINEVTEPEELIEGMRTCENFWCKSPYKVKYYESEGYPKECPKCIDFDTRLSGGVESGEKHYEGPRQDGMAHEVEFHFSKFKNGKGFWNK